MSVQALLKVICMTVIGAPPIVAATQGLVIPPAASAAMAILSLLAGLALSELQPGFTPRSMADRIMSQSEEQRSELLKELERRARSRVSTHDEIARQAAGVRRHLGE